MYRRKSFHAPSRFYYLPANLGIPLIGDHHSILCLHHHMVIFILFSLCVPYSKFPSTYKDMVTLD